MKKIIFVALCLSLVAIPGLAKTTSTPKQSSSDEVNGLLNTLDNKPATSSPQKSATGERRTIGPFTFPASGAIAKALPDISMIGTFSAAYFTTDPTTDRGADPAKTGFNLQEIEIGVQSNIDPYLRGDAFLSFGEDTIEVEEAYVTTLGFVRGLQIRGGRFRMPFGRQNPKHLEQWQFADTTLVNRYFLGPDGMSEVGIDAEYTLPLPFYVQLQASLNNGDNDTSFGGTRKQDLVYQGRLATSFDVSKNATALLGASLAFGQNTTGLGNQTTIYGGDAMIKWKTLNANSSFLWQNEFMLRRMQFPGILRQDGGFYSLADYQFAKRWHIEGRYDLVGVPASALVREWRATPALAYDPTEFSRLRLQYEYDKPQSTKAVQAAFLELEFSMGPHGAHQF